jgi:hypothetical protein
MDKSIHIPGAPERIATPISSAEMSQRVLNLLRGWQFQRKHGSLYDRGSADSYYGRPRDPHYGGVGGDSGPRVDQGLSIDEIKEYYAGYEYNERFGDKKDYR